MSFSLRTIHFLCHFPTSNVVQLLHYKLDAIKVRKFSKEKKAHSFKMFDCIKRGRHSCSDRRGVIRCTIFRLAAAMHFATVKPLCVSNTRISSTIFALCSCAMLMRGIKCLSDFSINHIIARGIKWCLNTTAEHTTQMSYQAPLGMQLCADVTSISRRQISTLSFRAISSSGLSVCNK